MTKQEFERIYEKYYKILLNYERKHMREDMVEDMVQEVFCLAWEKREQLEKSENPLKWLMNVAKNKNRDYWRKYYVETISIDDVEVELGREDQGLERKELQLFLQQYLNPKERQAFLNIYLKERSQKEMARVQGVSIGILRKNLAGIKQRLAYALKEQKGVNRKTYK